MSPQVSSYIALFFLILGFAAAWIMLEIQGNPKKRENLRFLTRTHRILGYLFIVVYAVMVGIMIRKAGSHWQEYPPRVVWHAGAALFLFPLLIFKVAAARLQKRFFAYLPAVGMIIVTAAFVLISLTAGYYFLHRSKVGYTLVTDADQQIYHERFAAQFLGEKCRKCHPLERIFRVEKSREEWIETVNRMAERDVPHIRPSEIKQIVLYLSSPREAAEKQAGEEPGEVTGEVLVQQKCTLCHELDRVFAANQDASAWRVTIGRMIENAEEIGITGFLSENEIEKIIQSLMKGGGQNG